MNSLKTRRLAATAVCAMGMAAGAVQAEELPDAPKAQQQTTPPVTGIRSNRPAAIAARRWSDVVNPGEKPPRLTNKDKLLFPLHEELRWTTAVPVLFDAEYGVLTNSDPKYGTNGAAWGKRVGAAALRQASTRLFTDGLLPIVFREDPRYYRQAYGTYTSRTFHALRRIYITQSDTGQRTFNYSDIVGRGMGAALTQAYYPDRSRDAEVVFSTWGLSIVALGGGNLFEEFWPDLRAKFFHGLNP